MFGKDEYVKKLKSIPMPALLMNWQLMWVVGKLPKADYFELQLDESTDVSNDAQLLAFLWFVDQNEMQEEFRFCKQLPGGKKKSSEIFKVIDNFFREHDIPSPKCVALCTDGARAMYDALHAS